MGSHIVICHLTEVILTPLPPAIYPGVLPVFIYRPKKDERLSWPKRLVIPRWFTHRWSPIQVLTGPETNTAIKHPVPDRVKPSFVIFDIRALGRACKLSVSAWNSCEWTKTQN